MNDTIDRYETLGYEPDEELRFFVAGDPFHTDVGTVHLRNRRSRDELIAQTDWALGRQRAVCGVTGSIYGGIGKFDDDRLCRRCMKALGDQTLRVFERMEW